MNSSAVNFSVFLGKTIFWVMNLLPMIGSNWLIPISTCFLGTFNSNAQPFYVLLDNDEKQLTDSRSYDLDINGFINFLDDGKRKFKEIDN